MILEVTQKDIHIGVRGDSCQCAAAKAIKRALDIPLNDDIRDYEYVDVTHEFIYVYCNGRRVRHYTVPKKLANFIAKFDEKGKSAVKPGRFTIKRLEVETDF